MQGWLIALCSMRYLERKYLDKEGEHGSCIDIDIFNLRRDERKMKSVLTKYEDICLFCGRPAEAERHLIFGTAGRELSEKDGLKVPVCNSRHNIGEKLKRIHDNPMAEKMSKIIGKLAWEKQWILKDAAHDPDEEEQMQKLEDRIARKEFVRRYGKSYL